MILKYKNGLDYFIDFDRIMRTEFTLLNPKSYEQRNFNLARKGQRSRRTRTVSQRSKTKELES